MYFCDICDCAYKIAGVKNMTILDGYQSFLSDPTWQNLVSRNLMKFIIIVISKDSY